jgi:hypothetical protein
MSNRAQKDPPLETVVTSSYSEEDGPLTIVHRKRGFLRDVYISDLEKTLWSKRFKLDGKARLVELSDQLRSQLDAAGLPTDKWQVTPRELDFAYHPDEHGFVADDDIWLQIVEESTEPLTRLRVAADLLQSLNRLFVQLTEDQLCEVYRAITLFHLHRVIEELHEPAISGAASKKNRGKGPNARKEKARALRRLILAMAEEFWNSHPRLIGQPVNTANKIVNAVNEAITSQKLSHKPLAAKTIADHLSVALREARQHR